MKKIMKIPDNNFIESAKVLFAPKWQHSDFVSLNLKANGFDTDKPIIAACFFDENNEPTGDMIYVQENR